MESNDLLFSFFFYQDITVDEWRMCVCVCDRMNNNNNGNPNNWQSFFSRLFQLSFVVLFDFKRDGDDLGM